MARRLVALAGNRLDLVRLEAREVQEQLVRTLLFAALGALCALFAVLGLSTLVVVVLWPWSPILAVGLPTAAHLLGAAWAFRAVRQLWRTRPWFSDTTAEFRRDRDALNSFLQ